MTPGALVPPKAVASSGTAQNAPPMGKASRMDIGERRRAICAVTTLIASGVKASS
jgi:hypothetical protein